MLGGQSMNVQLNKNIGEIQSGLIVYLYEGISNSLKTSKSSIWNIFNGSIGWNLLFVGGRHCFLVNWKEVMTK